ncbi:hypothetical protein BJV82DRAFT_94429 [Fennellomyces sp. T-0311]|nr:hypothetical protein BJV82DRAFT_94429 [Fennellomyces sp. T-0311]
MVVAFGFTGVSTALTVMSDIEVLDTITWSWTSVYNPSNGFGDGSNPKNGIGDQSKTTAVIPSTPSMAIVAGAVTGVLVVLVLIIVALYMFNYHHHRQKQKQDQMQEHSRPRRRQPPHWLGHGSEDPFATESDMDSPITKDTPVLVSVPERAEHLDRAPTRLQIATRPEVIHYRRPSELPHLPSPWTPAIRQSFPPASSEWMVRRAATAPHHFHRPYLSKPDEPFASIPKLHIRRSATTPRAASSVKPDLSEEEDSMFDQQEFVLRSTDDDFPAFSQQQSEAEYTEGEHQDDINSMEGRDLRNIRSLSSLHQLETVSSRSFLSVPSLDRDSRTNNERISSFQRHSG